MAKETPEKTVEDVPFVFQIAELAVIRSQLGPVVEDLPEDIAFNFGLKIEHFVDLSTGIVRMVVYLTVTNSETKAQYASMSIGLAYQIKDIQQQPLEDDKIPNHKMQILNSISLSTVRGIFYSMVRGTFLSRAIVPIIPSDYFKQE